MSRASSTGSVSLRRLFPAATFVGCSDIEVTSPTIDSRTLGLGQTFFAVRGAKHDGHLFLAEATCRGAASLVVERLQSGVTPPQCIVPDTRAAYGILCQALQGNPASQLKVIGVTGTNGKTTTAILVRSVLEAAGHRVGLVGTVEQFDGIKSSPATLTTPGPDELARLMRSMVDAGCSHVVMEVSSHALQQRRTAGIAFDTAVFTNLSQDHLDYHGDIEAYRAVKGRLFRELGSNAGAVLNAEDATSQVYKAECSGQVTSYAIRTPADIAGGDIRPSLDGSRFRIWGRDGHYDIETPLLGEHNVYNCVAAAAVGHRYGIDRATIQAGIERVREIPGRLQPVCCGQPFQVLVDYAHTPDAIRSVLKSLRAATKGRTLILFGAGGDRDRTKRPAMAQVAEALADMIVVTSDNPRTEDPQQIIRDILAGFRRAHALAIEPDRRTAIALVLSLARPGDCVVIAGKGHEAYQIVGDQRLPFDDRQVAAECLAKYVGKFQIGPGDGTEKRRSVPSQRDAA
ncbi:MAG: UDP-N-acetylmuramoyl-L-alanyl-D-glutamate--2,6-diaminopimelate ligase [Planctomycetes bacterium]|nr:UDP-N-acetylmuramoyl-L-alanyl-D-glutamate--2,6-diaminopimelate ligase [Planctomycetota bacterium]